MDIHKVIFCKVTATKTLKYILQRNVGYSSHFWADASFCEKSFLYSRIMKTFYVGMLFVNIKPYQRDPSQETNMNRGLLIRACLDSVEVLEAH